MIQVGDTLPDATLVEKHEEVKVHDILKGKLCVVLGMPGASRRAVAVLRVADTSRLSRAGAFTPGCTKARTSRRCPASGLRC